VVGFESGKAQTARAEAAGDIPDLLRRWVLDGGGVAFEIARQAAN
jgi:hypothetical protein